MQLPNRPACAAKDPRGWHRVTPAPVAGAMPSDGSFELRGDEEVGPPIGARFPDLELTDQFGLLVDLHRDRGGRSALIVVHRSAGW
jgi:hypothetical protein